MTTAELPVNAVKDKPITHLTLSQLRLDGNNPRFAEFVTNRSTQRDIVNLIVRQFGVDDVLSSIAVSGYFSAEPLVCQQAEDDTYTVVEGNRRLAAMLILSNDERARDHGQRIEKYQHIHSQHDKPAFDPVPAIVFTEQDNKDSLLSYLGVRHIVSTKEWDSYAKAAWVANALENSNLRLDDIAEMIGDTRGTIQRMLQGYHVIEQLREGGHFNPEHSLKKGRGSNTQYPFSWVYTLLGYQQAKQFIKLDNDPENPAPIPDERLDHAALVVRAMFGDSSKGATPAIDDSRAIPELAKVLTSPEKVTYLRQGKKVAEINRLTQPLDELIGDALTSILGQLRELSGRLSEADLSQTLAANLLRSTSAIKKQADSLHRNISGVATGDDD